ncbi:MAG: PLP-dependent lyase/thiolase [Ilumatobacteraceae bacterium]
MRCAACGVHVDIAAPLSWACPNATAADRHHALQLVDGPAAPASPRRADGGPGPFGRFRSRLAWDSFASANGMTDAARAALVASLDAPLGFSITPFGRADALSDALGFSDRGGVWVKDETGQVGGSHKARHLFTILLHLRAAEALGLATWRSPEERPTLAIASCGNAAIAAATLAQSVAWPIEVFVPPTADAAVLDLLGSLGAQVVTCPRRDADPPGDPCVHRFREAVAGGAVPFSVQGTENVWCLDGGRTIGWEIADAGVALDRVFVQVGGGALAAGVAAGLGGARLHTVQTGSSAPLVRAWQRADHEARRRPATHWDELMWPWEDVRPSLADGILDDETYDWIPVVEAMTASGGAAVELDETHVRRAYDLVHEHTSVDASATGTAGLAGVLATRDAIADDEKVAIVLSGIRR